MIRGSNERYNRKNNVFQKHLTVDIFHNKINISYQNTMADHFNDFFVGVRP